MGRGLMGVAADVMPPLEKRTKSFAKLLITKSLLGHPLAPAEIVELARLSGLVTDEGKNVLEE